MKIRIELDEEQKEDEVVIHCRSLTDEIRRIQRAVSEALSPEQNIILYKGDTEFYIPMEDILFFETEGSVLNPRQCIPDQIPALRIGGTVFRQLHPGIQISPCQCAGDLFPESEHSFCNRRNFLCRVAQTGFRVETL